MRLPISCAVLLLLPAAAAAQNEKVQDALDQKLATVRFVQKLQAPDGAFSPGPRDPKADAPPKPGLRATLAAVRSLKSLTGKPAKEAVPNAEKTAAFVLACFDPTTGGFADTPGGKADVALTSAGVMAAVDLGVLKEKFAKAMDYLKASAKTFEDVRIGAAAVEAWGVKDCPFDLNPWNEAAGKEIGTKLPPIQDGGARAIGSIVAFTYRLGLQKDTDSKPAQIAQLLDRGRLPDGGWKKQGEKASDLETTYRVMRAFYLLKEKPKDVTMLRAFVATCRNADGGYGVVPGAASTAGGVYYATTVTKWLDEMEKK